MNRTSSNTSRKLQSSALVKIMPADIEHARRHGPAAVEYYRGFGLAEARSRALSLVASGAIPVAGMLLLDWSPTAMVIFMLIDAWITVVIDCLRFGLAAPWLRESHARDHLAGEMINIVDGLDDGSGLRTPRGNAPGPGLIIALGSVSSLFMIPVAAVALEQMGLASVREVLSEKYFLWLVAGDCALRIVGALFAVWTARRHPPGTTVLFAESGSVAVLQAGLLVLVWLPLNWGQTGLLLMFAVLYLTRIAFGIFALWWMPRAVVALERRVASGDFGLRREAVDKDRDTENAEEKQREHGESAPQDVI
jgi:hypothetical protein